MNEYETETRDEILLSYYSCYYYYYSERYKYIERVCARTPTPTQAVFTCHVMCVVQRAAGVRQCSPVSSRFTARRRSTCSTRAHRMLMHTCCCRSVARPTLLSYRISYLICLEFTTSTRLVFPLRRYCRCVQCSVFTPLSSDLLSTFLTQTACARGRRSLSGCGRRDASAGRLGGRVHAPCGRRQRAPAHRQYARQHRRVLEVTATASLTTCLATRCNRS